MTSHLSFAVFLSRRDAELLIMSPRALRRERERCEKIQPKARHCLRLSIFRALLSGLPSSGEVLGEIFDYGQYIIQPETLCPTGWYTDAILALTAYIHARSEQMPLPPNIACGTLPSITLVPIENSPVYIPSCIPREDTYCTHATPHSYKVAPFAASRPAESIGIHVSK